MLGPCSLQNHLEVFNEIAGPGFSRLIGQKLGGPRHLKFVVLSKCKGSLRAKGVCLNVWNWE